MILLTGPPVGLSFMLGALPQRQSFLQRIFVLIFRLVLGKEELVHNFVLCWYMQRNKIVLIINGVSLFRIRRFFSPRRIRILGTHFKRLLTSLKDRHHLTGGQISFKANRLFWHRCNIIHYYVEEKLRCGNGIECKTLISEVCISFKTVPSSATIALARLRLHYSQGLLQHSLLFLASQSDIPSHSHPIPIPIQSHL